MARERINGAASRLSAAWNILRGRLVSGDDEIREGPAERGIQKVDDRHQPPPEVEEMHRLKTERPIGISVTHPGFRGQPNEKSDGPGYKLGVRMSELCRDLEEIARGLALRPEVPRIRELSARLEKTSRELRGLVEKIR